MMAPGDLAGCDLVADEIADALQLAREKLPEWQAGDSAWPAFWPSGCDRQNQKRKRR